MKEMEWRKITTNKIRNRKIRKWIRAHEAHIKTNAHKQTEDRQYAVCDVRGMEVGQK